MKVEEIERPSLRIQNLPHNGIDLNLFPGLGIEQEGILMKLVHLVGCPYPIEIGILEPDVLIERIYIAQNEMHISLEVKILIPDLFDLMGTDPEVTLQGSLYLRVLLSGAPLIFLSFRIQTIFQATGDMVTPLWLMCITLVIRFISGSV